LAKPEVDFNGQAVADRFIYCINVELEVGYREFVHAVSAIFLLPVWPEMAVCGLFAPVMRVLRRIVASRLAQSATTRQPTTGVLLPVQREVNIRHRRSPHSPGVLFCRSEAF